MMSCTSGQPQVTWSTSGALGADPGDPLEWRQSYWNVPGADRGRPEEANPTHHKEQDNDLLTNKILPHNYEVVIDEKMCPTQPDRFEVWNLEMHVVFKEEDNSRIDPLHLTSKA